jgi:hypothetical protein
LLSWKVGHDVVGPVEQLGVDAVAFDQPVEMIPTPPAALVALDVELPDTIPLSLLARADEVIE